MHIRPDNKHALGGGRTTTTRTIWCRTPSSWRSRPAGRPGGRARPPLPDVVAAPPPEDRRGRAREPVRGDDRVPAREASGPHDEPGHPRSRVLWPDGRLGVVEEFGFGGSGIDDADLHASPGKFAAQRVG